MRRLAFQRENKRYECYTGPKPKRGKERKQHNEHRVVREVSGNNTYITSCRSPSDWSHDAPTSIPEREQEV